MKGKLFGISIKSISSSILSDSLSHSLELKNLNQQADNKMI